MEELRRMNLQLFADDGTGDTSGDMGDTSTEDTGVNDGDLTPGGQSDTEGDMGDGSATIPDGYIPKEVAEKHISSRVNELNQKYRPYREVVEELQQVTGMTLDQIRAYIRQYSQQANVNPNVDPQLAETQRLAHTAGQTALETRRMVEEQILKQNPLYSDYDLVKDKVVEYADRYGLSLEQAYWAVNGANRAANIQKEVEQRTLARIKERDGLGAEGDGAAEYKKLGLSAEEIQFAKASGMTPEEYAKMKNIKTLDEFEREFSKN